VLLLCISSNTIYTNMKYIFTFLFSLLFSLSLYAQDATLSVQGVLRNSDGTAVPDGTKNITFKLYKEPSAGTAIWTETQSLDINGGIYNAVLGSKTAFDNVGFDATYYLGVSVGGGTELTPRAQLTTAPYALSLIGSSNVFPSAGRVGVGEASPGTKLHVKDNGGVLRLQGDDHVYLELYPGTSRTSYIGYTDANATDLTITNTKGDLKLAPSGNLNLSNGVDLNISYGESLKWDFGGANEIVMQGTDKGLIFKNNNGTAFGNRMKLSKAGHLVFYNGSELHMDGGEYLRWASGTTWETAIREYKGGLYFYTKQDGSLSDKMILSQEGNLRLNGTLKVDGDDMQGFASYAYYALKDGDTYTGYSTNDATYSIAAEGRIRASEFNAISDKRVKTNLKSSNAKKDLKTLNQINVTDFKYIDEVAYHGKVKKGFIAQQVESVFPEAVNRSSNFIPSIYANADVELVKNKAVISLSKSHSLKVGDKVKLIAPEGIVEKEVISVASDAFTISAEGIQSGKLFVYGHKVDDFRAVDYDRIFTLAVSAVQELSRKVEALEKENHKLKTYNATASVKVVELEQEQAQLATRLEQLERLLIQASNK
jgi:hypothetical protein